MHRVVKYFLVGFVALSLASCGTIVNFDIKADGDDKDTDGSGFDATGQYQRLVCIAIEDYLTLDFRSIPEMMI